MPFEALSSLIHLDFPNVPPEWVPLIFSFDPDLPLFPIQYFHVLATDLGDERPGIQDRAFGYIRHVSIDVHTHILRAEIVCNKDLSSPANEARFYAAVRVEIAQRLGLADPVILQDILSIFPPASHFSATISVLTEMWYRVVGHGYGNQLPFGRFWDQVWGLARAYASYRSETGRKGELIQTHYFAMRFGEEVASAEGFPFVEFRLLPTWQELTDYGNPLNLFPKFQRLVNAALALCELPSFGAFELSNWSYTGLMAGLGGPNLNTIAFMANFVHAVGGQHRASLVDCFNAFSKGPIRTITFLMALNDFRQIHRAIPTPVGSALPRINPPNFLAPDTAEIAFYLRHQQSKKVMAIYAQQAHANRHAFPMDTWIASILAHPLNIAVYDYQNGKIRDTATNRQILIAFISAAAQLGKVERLLWIAAQARKIHSPVCDDALWCIKESADFWARGANPLACKACNIGIRNACPAYHSIRETLVGFNGSEPNAEFNLVTSHQNNADHGQSFTRSIRQGGVPVDEDTATDYASSFAGYPNHGHADGEPMTVEEFIADY
jgi:hypothetical protein